MRGCREKDHPAVRIQSQPGQKLEPLLPTLVGADAGMGFIDDHEIRASACEAFPAFLGLDVVEADNSEGTGIEQALCEWQATLQPTCGAGGDRDGFDPKSI